MSECCCIPKNHLFAGLGVNAKKIMELLGEGYGQQEIADRVGCSQQNVSRILSRMQVRFDCETSNELIVVAAAEMQRRSCEKIRGAE